MKLQKDTRFATGLLLILVLLLAGSISACSSEQTPEGGTAEKTRTQWLIADKVSVEQGGMTTSGATTLASLTVTGAAALDGGITADTTAFTVADTSGNVATAGTLLAAGAASLNGGITVDTSNFAVNGTTGAVSTASTLAVTGLSTLTGGYRVGGDAELEANQLYLDVGHTAYIEAAAGNLNIRVPTSSTVDIENGGLTVAGNANIVGTLTVNSSRFSVDGSTGDVTLYGGAQIYPSGAITNTGPVFNCMTTVAYTDTANKGLCKIPANANVIDVTVHVTTLFNDSGTDVLNCGTTWADPDEYIDAADVSSASVLRTGSAGTMPFTSLGDIGVAAQTIWCKYTGQNSNASAGTAIVLIYYVVD